MPAVRLGNTLEPHYRRMARRQGLALSKSPRRDPRAVDYGLYALTDGGTGFLVTEAIAGQFSHSQTLDEIEAYLTTGEQKRGKR